MVVVRRHVVREQRNRVIRVVLFGAGAVTASQVARLSSCLRVFVLNRKGNRKEEEMLG